MVRIESAGLILRIQNAFGLFIEKDFLFPLLSTPYLTISFEMFSWLNNIHLYYLAQPIWIRLYMVIHTSSWLLSWFEFKFQTVSYECSFLLITDFQHYYFHFVFSPWLSLQYTFVYHIPYCTLIPIFHPSKNVFFSHFWSCFDKCYNHFWSW